MKNLAVFAILLGFLGVACGTEPVVGTQPASSGVVDDASTNFGSSLDQLDAGADTTVEDDSSDETSFEDDGYPAYDGYDLDCGDIGHPVTVDGADAHRLDADGDGIGCEGW